MMFRIYTKMFQTKGTVGSWTGSQDTKGTLVEKVVRCK